jgi:Ca2+-binding RTX toxin-like protein
VSNQTGYLPVESLEGRTLFAVGPLPSVSLVDGVLQVSATQGSDVVEVTLDTSDVSKVDVTVNGVLQQFNLAEVLKVNVFGGPGDDVLSVLGLSLVTRINGGAGADILTGALGSNWLYGGNGIDSLFGNIGIDHLFGGDGIDNLFGGDGIDYLDGGLGLDIITGGLGQDIFRGYDRARELVDKATNEVHVSYLAALDKVNSFFDDVKEFFGF